jgi:hypothetical protein
MPKYAEGYNKGLIPYCTNDQGTDNYPDSSYNNLTNSEKEFLDGFIPDGYDYCGIHTIYNIDIIQIIETIL